MATDYEQFYRENPNGLGEPTRVFVEFFEALAQSSAKVLDVGRGQGRDGSCQSISNRSPASFGGASQRKLHRENRMSAVHDDSLTGHEIAVFRG